MNAIMQTATGLVLSCFAGYGLLWYMGKIEGNFALLLFAATMVTGLYWAAERLYFLPQRRAAAKREPQPEPEIENTDPRSSSRRCHRHDHG